MSANCTKDFQITVGGSLVAYWNFDEAAGTTRADSTPNSNTLSQALGTIGSTAGLISNALRLAFTTAPSINGTITPTWNGQSITIAGWIRQTPGALLFNSTKYYFSGAVGLEWSLGLDAINNNEYRGVFVDEFGAIVNVASGVVIAAGSFDFVLLQLDIPNLRVGISVNNSAIVTAAIPGAPSVPASNGFNSRNQDASGNRDLDEMGIWYRLLEAFEIASLYNGGAGTTYPAVPT